MSNEENGHLKGDCPVTADPKSQEIFKEIEERGSWRMQSHEKYQDRVGFGGLYDHLSRDCYEAGYITGRKDAEKEIETLRVKLRTCKNDYWFMTTLLSSFPSNREEEVKYCIERMNFRKPLFGDDE